MDIFDSVYHGTPPWEIGRPQKAFVELARAGEVAGSVLDVGCGTGDHVLFFAEEGHEVLGIDTAALAIRKAEEKAAGRGLQAQFLVRDALDLSGLEQTFDTVIDSGFFHTLSDEDRPVFVDNLAAVLAPGGRYFMLCFGDQNPGEYPLPRRIAEGEIRDAFRDGWRINYIRPAIFENSIQVEGHHAWLASMTRSGE
ncbi:class I SAM-dependent methyltransferase [Methanoculleus sp. FWC-SCC3]|uniref:Class I SAM-dependent methyltransferase n=1 Tax=Methanoculleus methanifontis TaxID=2584086 RepID=A0ABT8M590_9EURY|nr:class I SAM-dependent methyltransferase [Methanoculleus sp. FWC-SCC3]MDN7013762.1 class I SAM-dependent methyltransferase [Methanoculleus sp. FWC-SCC3]